MRHRFGDQGHTNSRGMFFKFPHTSNILILVSTLIFRFASRHSFVTHSARSLASRFYVVKRTASKTIDKVACWPSIVVCSIAKRKALKSAKKNTIRWVILPSVVTSALDVVVNVLISINECAFHVILLPLHSPFHVRSTRICMLKNILIGLAMDSTGTWGARRRLSQ